MQTEFFLKVTFVSEECNYRGVGGVWCFLRLVEEVKLRASSCQLQNEDVYMNTTFQDFIQMCVRKLRGEDGEEELVVDYVNATSAATQPPPC